MEVYHCGARPRQRTDQCCQNMQEVQQILCEVRLTVDTFAVYPLIFAKQ